MASGRQVFFLVTRTSSDHTISLQPQRTQMLLLWTILLWWRPAIGHYSVLLVFAVHFSRDSSSIRYQTCTKPEPTAKYSWWNSKENNGFTLQKIWWVNSEKKMKQANKTETNRLASNALLGPSKRRKRSVCREPTPSDTLSDSDTDLAVIFDDFSTEEEQDADCVHCTGRLSEDHKGEERIRCAKYFRWAYTLGAGMEEEFVCEPVRDKHCLVLSLYPSCLYFF